MAFTSAVNSKQARLDVRRGGKKFVKGLRHELGLCTLQRQTKPQPPLHTTVMPTISPSLTTGKTRQIQSFQSRDFFLRHVSLILKYIYFLKDLARERPREILVFCRSDAATHLK